MTTNMLGIFILVATIVAQANAVQTHDIYWRYGADQSKANSESYQVGDKLVFRYPSGIENVVEVDQKSFENCIVPPSAKVFTSGFDEINLDKPGPRWFICGVGNGKRCKDGGMKLHIEVKPSLIVETSTGPSGEEFVVGDDEGWTANVDFQAWANGKEFDIGDKLVFNYPKGKHNVFKVDESAFKECTIDPENEALTSGHDVITLQAAGGVGFISGIGKDCEKGMKLLIDVICPNAKPKRRALQGRRKQLVPPN